MVDKFNNDNIKDKVENYSTWEKNITRISGGPCFLRLGHQWGHI